MIINNQKEQTNLKTSVTYKGNGTQKQFDFPFDYLRKAFVKVSVNDAIVDGYIIDNRSVIFNNAPASNDVIVIYRETSTDRLVSWADASVLKAADMTISQVQQLHVIEEGRDWTTTNSMVLNDSSEWEGRNHKIVNVLDPTAPQDVVTKHYMETVQGGFVQENTELKNEATKQAQIATTKANEADVSAKAAKVSETNAKASELAAKASQDAAKVSETNAKASEVAAKTSADKAKVSETNAKASEIVATTKASEASASASAAKASETKAKTSETNAGTSATTATQQATKATTEANRAKTEADRAKTAADSVGNPVVSIAQSNGNLTVTKGDGSSDTLTVTPAKASQAEAEAGTDDTKMMTPLKVLQSIKKYIATFLMTAVFTGIIKGVTPPNDANDKTIPTTEWVQALLASKVMSLVVQDYLLEQNGYIRFRFGLILQWGSANKGTVVFPISFVKACYAVSVCPISSTAYTSSIGANSLTKTSAYLYSYGQATNKVYYFAIGD